MRSKFSEGQLVEWITYGGRVVARCHIVRLSEEKFASDDKLLPCWVVDIVVNGEQCEIAEKNLRAVIVNA